MFAQDEHTKLLNKGKLSLQGPEKTAYIGDPNYIHLLDKKVNNYVGGKVKPQKKTRKKTRKKVNNYVGGKVKTQKKTRKKNIR